MLRRLVASSLDETCRLAGLQACRGLVTYLEAVDRNLSAAVGGCRHRRDKAARRRATPKRALSRASRPSRRRHVLTHLIRA